MEKVLVLFRFAVLKIIYHAPIADKLLKRLILFLLKQLVISSFQLIHQYIRLNVLPFPELLFQFIQ